MSELPYDYYIEVHKAHVTKFKKALRLALEEISEFKVNMKRINANTYRFFIKFEVSEEQIPQYIERLRKFLQDKLDFGVNVSPNPERKKMKDEKRK